jgi:2-haloacid dehalogenase
MSQFELLTFDCYGTLIDWELGMKNALKMLVKKKNLSISIENLPKRYIQIELGVEQERYRKYREVLTISVRRLFNELGIELTSDEEKIFVDTIPTWPPFKETKQVLEQLKKKYKLAILSNIDEDIIQQSIKLIGVKFDGVITAEQVKSYKPNFEHWKRMIKNFGLPKDKVLHIAASYIHDIVPAKELDFKTVWVNRKNESIEGSIKPDYEFSNLTPLLRVLL